MMVASTVVSRVRIQLNDTVESYRYDDQELFKYLTSACRDLGLERPDLLLSSSGVLNTVVDITASSDLLVYSDEMLIPLIDFMCYRALMTDSEDVQNMSLAKDHFQAYQNAIH